MSRISAFGPWTGQIHAGDKQEKAIARAQLAETTPLTVDHSSQTAVFYGSGKAPYETSLSTCTCNDFTRRKLPCKHIYRLAMELGIIDLPYKTGESKGARLERQLFLEDAVSIIESLSENTQRQLMQMLGMTNFNISDRQNPYLFTDLSVIEDLRGCPLLEERPAAALILSQMKRADLNALIAQTGITNPPKKNASSSVLSQWLQDNVTNLTAILPPYVAFSFVPSFDRAQRSTYQYLLRKYESDSVFLPEGDIASVPHGSNPPAFTISVSPSGVTSSVTGNPDAFYFPDDDITALLTKYGCNRCLGGFVPDK